MWKSDFCIKFPDFYRNPQIFHTIEFPRLLQGFQIYKKVTTLVKYDSLLMVEVKKRKEALSKY